ncbi:hypothetical protein GTQ45_03670 [Pyruvatibacter mobilis]|uniref:HNH nuclease domain-containing protein n=1 Tax=Pyruvatibacter mobilis TaxID=1712261 RepID=A0A845Q9J4_9HYPH|nr:hypothetical protein [Pyruvatibacter mobilis]QJD76010.1 HNH endonuclease [Pyruvatibacter mobilis]GGD20403.1 hypothetical protein GCM10011587_26210 [Pyruvatibacter mobilis]
MAAYSGRCASNGCNVTEAPDVAHISPCRRKAANDVRKGLLLRADIHDLFDIGLIAGDTETMSVVLSIEVRATKYSYLHGKEVRLSGDENLWPRKEALASYKSWSQL